MLMFVSASAVDPLDQMFVYLETAQAECDKNSVQEMVVRL
jgi:hypothetical protein